MSAGGFVGSVYVSDQGLVLSITVQPETLEFSDGSVVNEIASPGPFTQGAPSVTVSGGRRGRGRIYARTVTLVPDVRDGVPPGYQPGGRLRIPIVDLSLWSQLNKGTSVVYQSIEYKVSGKQPEKVT